MTKYKIGLLFGLLMAVVIALSLSPSPFSNYIIEEDTPVAELLAKLGEASPNEVDPAVQNASAEVGADLVLRGIAAKPNGGKTSKQSKHFVCTSCHNVEKEDPDLRYSDPETRLPYVRKKGLPFLQGTSLYGAVNRSSFYNGDYEQKYGALVEPARNNIREAIQLCAVECSQGRALEPWEMESVLAYLWTLQLKVSDLAISDSELQKVQKAIQQSRGKDQAVALVKQYYLDGSPATFVDPPGDRTTGHPNVQPGNTENGAMLYEQSCLHCHENQRYSYFNLDYANTTFKFLDKHFPKYTRYSTYQVGRYGTSPHPGKRAYMPNYTLEKMSYQQLEDLKAYISQQANL